MRALIAHGLGLNNKLNPTVLNQHDEDQQPHPSYSIHIKKNNELEISLGLLIIDTVTAHHIHLVNRQRIIVTFL